MIKARSPRFKQGLLDLINYINKTHNTRKMTLLEIGSYIGESTCIFAKYFEKVISVDPYKDKLLDKVLRQSKAVDIEKAFVKNTSNFKNIIKIKKESLIYANEFNNLVDIVYIDGLHDYKNVKADIFAWLPVCTKYIAGHDFWPKKFSGVVKAVHETIGKPDKIFCDYSWIKKLKGA